MAKDSIANVCTRSKLIFTLLVLDEVAKGLDHSSLQDGGHSHRVVGILVVNLENTGQKVQEAGSFIKNALRGENPEVLLPIHDANQIEHSDSGVDFQRNHRLDNLSLVFLLIVPVLLHEWLGKEILVDEFVEKLAEVRVVIGRFDLFRIRYF